MGIIGQHESLAKDIIRYSRLCYDRGLAAGSGGNLSARIPGGNVVLVTASGVALRDVDAANLVAVDVAGRVLEAPAGLKPSKEIGFHLEVLRARPHVNAVIHVHPASAIVYASRGLPIPLVTISARLKLKQGPIVADAPPGSRELCDLVARAAGKAGPDATVLLMARHGLLSFGPSLCAAFDDAELASETARVAMLIEDREARSLSIDAGTGIIDLSVPLSDATAFYPTDPPFSKRVHVYFPGTGVLVSKIETGLHIGTHVDAPLHVLPAGQPVSDMSPGLFLGEATAIDAPKRPGENIEPEDFRTADVRENDIVIFRTGWEERSGTPRFFQEEWPGFSVAAADALVGRKVKAVGLDSPSADSPREIAAGFAGHKRLLAAGIPIFEALVNLRSIVSQRFFFIGLPLGIQRGEASPVRALALLRAPPR
ncbi:MAG TPA: class II aldolase/adducin family protein [Spirochaetia bacterium]|nr:class II aldolase/adducin family protein [Spirochaetia bacterium]